MAYWLGFLFADGNVYKSSRKYKTKHQITLSLKCADHDHVLKFKDALNSTYAVGVMKSAIGGGCHSRHVIYNDNLGLDLINLGCVPRKSLILEWPNDLPHNYASHFTRGYFDGDGGIYYNLSSRNLVVQILGSHHFIPALQTAITDAVLSDIKARGYIKKISGGNCLRIEYGGNVVPTKVLDWMYEGSDESIRLNRKYIHYQKWKEVAHLNRQFRDQAMRHFLDSNYRIELNECKQAHLCPRKRDLCHQNNYTSELL